MENERFFRKTKLLIILCVLIAISAQDNRLFSQIQKGSFNRTVLFGLQHQALKQHVDDSIKISLKYKPKADEKSFYQLPLDPLKLDYRHHPYYTPKIVDDFINMSIMDRPPSSSFVSLPTVALLAASVALQYAAVKLKMELTAQDYLLEDKYYPILKALWLKSPQTAQALYRIDTIRNTRTMQSLQKDLEFLIDRRLLKMRKIPEGLTKYFPAQKKSDVIKLYDNSVMVDSSSNLRWISLEKCLKN